LGNLLLIKIKRRKRKAQFGFQEIKGEDETDVTSLTSFAQSHREKSNSYNSLGGSCRRRYGSDRNSANRKVGGKVKTQTK